MICAGRDLEFEGWNHGALKFWAYFGLWIRCIERPDHWQIEAKVKGDKEGMRWGVRVE